MVNIPNSATNTPAVLSRSVLLEENRLPIWEENAPREMNTVENPSTNTTLGTITLENLGTLRASARSSYERRVTTDR